jgi:hypothetical protein
MSWARARAARMAERSVLTASSKARISSCSLSLSRWGSPTDASPFGGSLGWHDRPSAPGWANLPCRRRMRSIPHRRPLLVVAPTPVVALNRAIAIGELQGPAAALALVDGLEDLDNYYPFHATRADLLGRLGRHGDAAAAYQRAAALAPTEAEREFLRMGGRASRRVKR